MDFVDLGMDLVDLGMGLMDLMDLKVDLMYLLDLGGGFKGFNGFLELILPGKVS